MTELEQLTSYCAENGRVCPKPLPWHQVWEMLPSKQHHSAEWNPLCPQSLPPGGAHQTTSSMISLRVARREIALPGVGKVCGVIALLSPSLTAVAKPHVARLDAERLQSAGEASVVQGLAPNIFPG
jgi:hypothetical protein